MVVTIPKRTLADNDVWLRDGVEAGRLRLASYGLVDAVAATANVLVDDAQRAGDTPYVFGSCSPA